MIDYVALFPADLIFFHFDAETDAAYTNEIFMAQLKVMITHHNFIALAVSFYQSCTTSN
jgi:hypothetical protein